MYQVPTCPQSQLVWFSEKAAPGCVEPGNGASPAQLCAPEYLQFPRENLRDLELNLLAVCSCPSIHLSKLLSFYNAFIMLENWGFTKEKGKS